MNDGFIESIFGKSRFDINIEDIIEFFSEPQEESSILEFKSGDVEINDLFKEVAAFLNTEGGLLIVGAPRETNKIVGKTTTKVCQGDITYSSFKNKDWLYQKLASNIVPSPVNLRIEEFILEKGNVFLIDIPQSNTPPHQSGADGKYYIRLERDAKPAPHGIIQALFNKRKLPLLSADITINKLDDYKSDIVVSIRNQSNVPAEKVSFLVDVYNIKFIESLHNFEFIKDSLGDKYSVSNHSNQILVSVINIPIRFKVTHLKKDFLIFIGYWCRDLDFEFQYFTFSPENETMINGSRLEGPLLLDELKRIQL
ncbi:ATP-binding protein [Flavobacterium sp. HXWNR29]|uniref:AlbA family DNA-binding domain-containing protein n=1 Tax=Flavobacterium odoriferum TaxID=2946604 RepID=UPI0021CB7FF9|nr:ATP-binding protein [Flavobacterium sp. HXWNR29]MCU4188911.1 ATP-binding protein [Flavobacterium sp. HXWNR29]